MLLPRECNVGFGPRNLRWQSRPDLGVEVGRQASPFGTADGAATRAEAGIIERALWRSSPE
eukprot:6345505-Karenia_brevis.AAC.1